MHYPGRLTSGRPTVLLNLDDRFDAILRFLPAVLPTEMEVLLTEMEVEGAVVSPCSLACAQGAGRRTRRRAYFFLKCFSTLTIAFTQSFDSCSAYFSLR